MLLFFKKEVLSFFLLFPLAAPAQTIDAASTPLNQAAHITSLARSSLFTSIASAGRRLVAAGERGRILWSDDSGQTWQQARTPTSVTLTNIRFASPEEGWATGQMGVILHTVDGGQDWAMQLDGVRANQLLVAAAQADIDTGGNTAVNQANLQAAQQFASGGPSVPFLAVLPLSPTQVIAAGGYGMAFASADAGRSWNALFDSLPNPNGLHFYAVIQDGADLLFAGEQGILLRRGADQHIFTLTTPFQGTFFGGLITPGKAVLLYGLQGTALRSADGGQSWQEFQSPDGAGIDTGTVLRNGDILLGDEAGNLLLSPDDGRSFRLVPTGGPVTALVEAPGPFIIIAGPQGLQRIGLNILEDNR